MNLENKSFSGLSERAQKYMKSLKQNKDWTCDKETIEKYFQTKKFPLHDRFIDFQMNFSGYTLRIKREEKEGDGRRRFDLLLFSKKNIIQNNYIDYFQTENDIWLYCGQHGVAPFSFCMNQKGEIATSDGDEIIKVIYSSVEKFIEQYAINSELKYTDNTYHRCANGIEIQDFMVKNDFKKISECSDKNSSWFENGFITVNYGTKWDSEDRYLRFFANQKKECDLWIEKFKTVLI